jgi:hypothetical protein
VLADAAFSEENHRYRRERRPRDGDPDQPSKTGAELAEDPLPPAVGHAVPQEAEGKQAQTVLAAKGAGGERVLPAEASPGFGAAGQVGRVPPAQMLPPRAHS